jgi:hypothetical protein
VLPPLYGLAVGDAAISAAQGGITGTDELRALSRAQCTRRGAAGCACSCPPSMHEPSHPENR